MAFLLSSFATGNTANLPGMLLSTVHRGVNFARNTRRFYRDLGGLRTTLSHDAPGYFGNWTSVPQLEGSIDGLTVNGYSPSRFLSFLFDPTFLVREISRWRVTFSLTHLWGMDWANVLSFNRIPTFREFINRIYEGIVTACQTITGFSTKLCLFVTKYWKFSSILGFLLLGYLWVVAFLSKCDGYTRYDPNNGVGPGHRINVNGPLADVNCYPSGAKDEAMSLFSDLRQVDSRLTNILGEKCVECKYTLRACICPTFQNSTVTVQDLLLSKRQEIVCKLIDLKRDLENDTFALGSTHTLPIDANGLCRILRTFGIKPLVDWNFKDKFHIADLRSHTEKHINCASSIMWHIRQRNLRVQICTPFGRFNVNIDRKFLPLFGVKGRDLVVAQEHARLLRRGALSEHFDSSLRSLLECSLAVPINDPSFLFRFDPMRDAFLVVRAIKYHSVLQGAEDF